jgi:hypothetical protein
MTGERRLVVGFYFVSSGIKRRREGLFVPFLNLSLGSFLYSVMIVFFFGCRESLEHIRFFWYYYSFFSIFFFGVSSLGGRRS